MIADERPGQRPSSKSRLRSSTPTTGYSPSWPPRFRFLRSESINNPDAGRSYLFVPKSAVFQEDGHEYVWVIREDTTLRKHQVEVVSTTDDSARVESGLKLNDAVVLTPVKTLRELETVRID